MRMAQVMCVLKTGLFSFIVGIALACSGTTGPSSGTRWGGVSGSGGATEQGGAAGSGGTTVQGDATGSSGASSSCSGSQTLGTWTATNWTASSSYFNLYASQNTVLARNWDSLVGGQMFLTTDEATSWTQISSADSDIDINPS